MKTNRAKWIKQRPCLEIPRDKKLSKAEQSLKILKETGMTPRYDGNQKCFHINKFINNR